MFCSSARRNSVDQRQPAPVLLVASGAVDRNRGARILCIVQRHLRATQSSRALCPCS
jgi:hypothetical protein